jgi:cytokinesis protein
MLLGANISNILSARKDLSITPSTKMKQLQWDKIPLQQAQKTVFSDDPTQEEEWLRKLQLDGVWVEMEEDFKAKQLVVNLMGSAFHLSEICVLVDHKLARQKQAELKSVLDPNTKKRVGKQTCRYHGEGCG